MAEVINGADNVCACMAGLSLERNSLLWPLPRRIRSEHEATPSEILDVPDESAHRSFA
jgi:hypothetical protein